MQDILEAFENYSDMGFDTLPLRPGTKVAWSMGWQRLSPEEMWRDAPLDSNLGLRAGGSARLAVIDCDDKERPGTLANVQNWLKGLGYPPDSYPLVRTASGVGGHIYLKLENSLSKNSCNLSTDVGAGEFRCGPGAYVVAPPSEVASRKYQMIQGELFHRPLITAQDVRQILKIRATPPKKANAWPSQSQRIPRRTMALLTGIGVERYSSRSDAEQAILTGLANNGFDFENALSLFKRFPCAGRFQEEYVQSQQGAIKWLRTSFDAALNFTSSGESRPRQLAKLAMEWAKNRAWIGRTGQYDKMVYIAHASIAYRAGRLSYAAAARDLANMTGLSPEACLTATERLRTYGLISLIKPWTASLSNTYRLESQTFTLPHRME